MEIEKICAYVWLLIIVLYLLCCFISWVMIIITGMSETNKVRTFKEELGTCSWKLLHSIVENYPEQPNKDEQQNVLLFLILFAEMYPCKPCSKHMLQYIYKNPIVAKSKKQLDYWMCSFHNSVNHRLGKRVYKCDYGEENEKSGTCSKKSNCNLCTSSKK